LLLFYQDDSVNELLVIQAVHDV